MNFDEASGTPCSITRACATPNNGTMNAGVSASWRTIGRGRFGAAVQRHDGMVSIADSASLDLTSAVTISAWVRWSGGADWQSLVLKERGTVTNPGLSYSLYANDPTRSRPAGFFRVGTADQSVASTTALPPNTWTHIAVTYGGGFMRFYVNGVQVTRSPRPGTSRRRTTRFGWREHAVGRVLRRPDRRRPHLQPCARGG
jgi:hypothetical protein